ncbi:MAG: methionine--tRNA ligase [Phycisphaerales bacterium]
MTSPADPAYITTPIYYVNDRPHIGHVYTTTVCDVWARFMRRAGRDVMFLTGTDEHGVKVEKSAVERGVSPQQHADENAAEFRRVLGMFSLTNDAFIRTTEPAHEHQVQAFIRRLQDAGAIYLGEFEGWYDEGQEEYHTETKAAELEFKSPISGKPLIRATEKNYYFKLSAFQARLEKLFAENPHLVQPDARRNEVLGRLREGLNDVPISRTNFTWGVPMPDDPGHVIYVWIDALLNYVSALGLGDADGVPAGLAEGEDPAAAAARRAGYWPPAVQVLGKEILWFHAVIWPAMLMALEMPLPKLIYAHSFWVSEGQKMSKSLGNFIDLEALQGYLDTYGIDALRWYLITQGPLGATDADFRAEQFHDVYGADLVNTVGNSCSRVTAMITKYYDGVVPSEVVDGERMVVADHNWPVLVEDAVARAMSAMERFEPAVAVQEGMALVRVVDAFINDTAPFKIAKDETRRDELGAILYQCIEALRIANLLLEPVLPERSAEFLAAIGCEPPAGGTFASLCGWGGLKPGTTVQKVALYPRVEMVAEA